MLALTKVLEAMRKKGIVFDTGLTRSEFGDIESRYGFRFPPDLREFLSLGLPISEDFPNWRTGQIKRAASVTPIAELLNWPPEGICFDVENNVFWMRDWGAKLADIQEALRLARAMVRKAPPLIPVFAHRFLPGEPLQEGNPVLSVRQTDIIHYGDNLASYLVREFELPVVPQANGNKSPRRIRFWSDIIDRNVTEFASQQADNE